MAVYFVLDPSGKGEDTFKQKAKILKKSIARPPQLYSADSVFSVLDSQEVLPGRFVVGKPLEPESQFCHQGNRGKELYLVGLVESF